MSASSGRPALALLSASQIPAVPSTSALAGLVAGFMAAVAYAQRHDAAAELVFARAVVAARVHPDYGYSHEFLAGAEMAKAGLAALAGTIGAMA